MNSQLINLLQTAVEKIQNSDLVIAKSLLEGALKIEAQNPDAIRLLGVLAAIQSDWTEALRLIDRAIEIDPKNGVSHSNRGNILRELKRFDEALQCYERAISLDSSYAEVHSNMGNALQGMQRYEEALQCYEKAISLDANYADAYSNKGNALQRMQRFDETLQCYEKAITLNPNNALAFYEADCIFNLRKEYGHSVVCIEQALQLNPQYIAALLELGLTYFQVKDYEKAIAAYEQALNIDQKCTRAWLEKGQIYSEMKEFRLAKESFKKALEIDPSVNFLHGQEIQATLQMCDWGDLSGQTQALAQEVEEGHKAAIPYNFISLLDDPYLIKRAIEIYATHLQGDITRAVIPLGEENKKIRLGYFSADFHNHPTAYLIAELFEKHDKSQFELIAFIFGRNQPDAMRERLVQAFDQFIDVDHKTEKEIAALSREMQIDIAIDLKGFTQEGRPEIFMHGAAPIQISYLAFPGTMGLECFDYIVADPILIPKDLQAAYIEKVIYMPDSYQVNDRHRKISSEKKSKQELGLPESSFIFCCFNNNYKIIPSVFDGWVRILHAIDGSVLWLFGDNPFAIENLRKEAIARGLDPSRLIFADRMDPADHLARYQLADLFLDTTPCNAHTTASDALWAGLPVLTLLGRSFGARVAASLLNAVGLSDLVVSTQEEYESLAIELATNAGKLCEIKYRLEQNRLTTPLFDTSLFTRYLEAAYIEAYDRQQAGLSPDHIYVEKSECSF